MKEEIALTHDVMMEEVTALAARYPFFAVTTLGKSLVGRELPLITVGTGEKSVLYVGSHHGMEWITSVLLLRYADEVGRLLSEGGKIFGVDAARLFEKRRVCIVPMLNPDGVELHLRGCDPRNPLTERLQGMSGGDFSRWQANGRGVDLNHNYNAGFDTYKAMESELGIFGGGPTRFSGAHPESEPETAALCAFVRSTDIRLLLALHTQGGEIYADYNGYLPPRGALIARRMEAMSGYAVAKPETAASYGGCKDWFIAEFDRPGFTIECGKGVNPLPIGDAEVIYSVIRGILLNAPSYV